MTKRWKSDVGRLRERLVAIIASYAGSSNPGVRKFCDELLRALTETTSAKKITGPAQLLGQRGGLKGGQARARKLSKEERVASARNAANLRWAAVREQKARDGEIDVERAAQGLGVLT